jgi:sacsin
MVSLHEAIFDFLPEDQSKLFAPFLMSLEVKLVCDIPKDISERLKTLPGVQIVDGTMLRTIFKSQLAKYQLLMQLKARPEVSRSLFDTLLAAIIPPVADYVDLVGCHILPLADGTVGTLDNTANTYYVATDEELKLFAFASKHLLTSSVAEKLGYVAENGRFNILRLELCHVGELIKTKPLVTAPDAEHDSWLCQFWEYWNDHPSSTDPWLSVDKFDVPIFKATCDGLQIYSTPLKFASLPAIVEPNEAGQLPLFAKIPGLYYFNRRQGFVPFSHCSPFLGAGGVGGSLGRYISKGGGCVSRGSISMGVSCLKIAFEEVDLPFVG